MAKECANLQQFQDLLKKWASCSFASGSSAALHTVTAYAKDGDYILGVVFHLKPSSVSDVAGIQSVHASLN